jgi:hypothetical protein
VVDVDDSALDVAIDHGFDPRYGARALKREIQRLLVLPIASLVMERTVEPHTVVRAGEKGGAIDLRCIDTPASKAAREEREPVTLPDGQRLSKDEISDLVSAAATEIAQLAKDADEAGLKSRVEELEERRREPSFWTDPTQAARIMRDLNRDAWTVDRLGRLRLWVGDTRDGLGEAKTKPQVSALGRRVIRLGVALAAARRELVVMAPDGYWDAIVEIRPVGAAAPLGRDLLVSTYRGWAVERRMVVEWVCHPLADDQPAILAIKGHFANGYLSLEPGLHRVRQDETLSVVSVRAGPWLDERSEPEFTTQRALKAKGAFGDNVRSRIECESGLVVQNGRTLSENRDLAAELDPSWRAMKPAKQEVIRRYGLTPLKIRDVQTGITSGRRSALGPHDFHALLCARIDAHAS